MESKFIHWRLLNGAFFFSGPNLLDMGSVTKSQSIGGLMRIVGFFVFLFSIQSFALGPIPNGTYKGDQYCRNSVGLVVVKQTLEVVVTDELMTWSGNTKKFVPVQFKKGFVKVYHYKGTGEDLELAGLGRGYFLENGLHFSAMLDVGNDIVTGTDTFTVSDGVISLKGGALGLDCSGSFTLQ